MSYLLYLESVDWSTFEKAFGSANEATVKAVVANVNIPHLRQWVFPQLTQAKVIALAQNAMMNGLDFASVSTADAKLLDVIVDAAFRTTKAGIRKKPISPNGIFGALLDALEPSFRKRRALSLLKTFRNGQRFGMKPGPKVERFILSPPQVAEASCTLCQIADKFPPDKDWADVFAEELVRPFELAAKKGDRGIRGSWG